MEAVTRVETLPSSQQSAPDAASRAACHASDLFCLHQALTRCATNLLGRPAAFLMPPDSASHDLWIPPDSNH